MLIPLLLALLADESTEPLGNLRELRGRLGLGQRREREKVPTLREAWARISNDIDVGILGAKGNANIENAWRTASFHVCRFANANYPDMLSLIQTGKTSPPLDVPGSGRTLMWIWGFLTALARQNPHSWREPLGDWPDDFDKIRDWSGATGEDPVKHSYPEALRLAQEWHDNLQQLTDIQFGDPVPDGLVLMRWPDGSTLQRLMVRAEFERESDAMDHCIGHDNEYWRGHVGGTQAHFSLRDPEGVPKVTLTLTGNPLSLDSQDRLMIWYHDVTQPEEPVRWIIDQIHGPHNESFLSLDKSIQQRIIGAIASLGVNVRSLTPPTVSKDAWQHYQDGTDFEYDRDEKWRPVEGTPTEQIMVNAALEAWRMRDLPERLSDEAYEISGMKKEEWREWAENAGLDEDQIEIGPKRWSKAMLEYDYGDACDQATDAILKEVDLISDLLTEHDWSLGSERSGRDGDRTWTISTNNEEVGEIRVKFGDRNYEPVFKAILNEENRSWRDCSASTKSMLDAMLDEGLIGVQNPDKMAGKPGKVVVPLKLWRLPPEQLVQALLQARMTVPDQVMARWRHPNMGTDED